ncbi:hypothetical protein C923_02111 [Plasmodium falciparum UGT5.1]|uniref:Uncharacterized protein n=1 Tax=Plasmodium falciparum UGT5.1 TaxID=1237627 RepID=W7JQM4_PLAFA|nr:hypothetical protein C923_02111 [Plasmodium falciparum UGT5.1]
MKNMNDENGSTIEGDPNTEKAKNKNNNNNDDINENIIDDEKKKKEQQQDDEEDEEDDEDDDEEDDEDDDEEDDADNDLCDQNVLIIGDENLSFSNYIIEAYASSNIYIASTLTEFQVNLLLKDLEKKKVNKCLHEKREIDDVSTNYGPFDFTRKFKERHVSKNVHIIFNVNLFNLKSYFPKNFFKAVFLILPGLSFNINDIQLKYNDKVTTLRIYYFLILVTLEITYISMKNSNIHLFWTSEKLKNFVENEEEEENNKNEPDDTNDLTQNDISLNDNEIYSHGNDGFKKESIHDTINSLKNLMFNNVEHDHDDNMDSNADHNMDSNADHNMDNHNIDSNTDHNMDSNADHNMDSNTDHNMDNVDGTINYEEDNNLNGQDEYYEENEEGDYTNEKDVNLINSSDINLEDNNEDINDNNYDNNDECDDDNKKDDNNYDNNNFIYDDDAINNNNNFIYDDAINNNNFISDDAINNNNNFIYDDESNGDYSDDNPEEETEKYSQDEENNIRDIFEDSYNKDNEINELLDDVNTSTFEDIEIIKYIYTNDDLKNKKSGLINIIRFPLLYEINLKKLMKIFCFYEHIKKEEKINTIFHIEDIINSYYPLVYGHHFMYNEFLKNCKFFSFVLKKKKKITIPEELVVLIPHIEYNYKIDSYHFLKKLYYSVFNEPRICYTSINEQIKHINQMRYKLYVHNLKTSKHFKNEKISSIHNNMISSYYIYQNHINNMIKNKTTCCINDDLWKTVLNPFDFFHLNNDVNVFFEYNILTNIYNKFVTTVNTDFNKLCVNFYIKKDYKQYEEDNTNEHNSKRIMKRKFNKNGLYNTIGDNKNKPPLLPTPKNESYKLVNSINNNHRHNINNMNNQRNGNRHKNNTNNNTLLYKHATNNIQNNFNKSYRNENNIRNSMHNNNYDNNTKREDKNQKYVKNENQREGTSRKNNASSVYRNYNVSNGNEHTNFNNNVSASHANFSYKPMRNNNNNNNNMRGDNNSMRGGYSMRNDQRNDQRNDHRNSMRNDHRNSMRNDQRNSMMNDQRNSMMNDQRNSMMNDQRNVKRRREESHEMNRRGDIYSNKRYDKRGRIDYDMKLKMDEKKNEKNIKNHSEMQDPYASTKDTSRNFDMNNFTISSERKSWKLPPPPPNIPPSYDRSSQRRTSNFYNNDDSSM